MIMAEKKFDTPQENFWAEEFGNEYIHRNNSIDKIASNVSFFAKALSGKGKINSCIEFGANIGMNLRALKLLYPGMEQAAIEINSKAASMLKEFLGEGKVFEGSILEYNIPVQHELVLIKGVLIHINPDILNDIYKKLYNSSNKYILVCEYYNPTPVEVKYRGHEGKLFKRDFAGEMLDQYKDLRLVDYGFVYSRDVSFPQDDITWFLLEK